MYHSRMPSLRTQEGNLLRRPKECPQNMSWLRIQEKSNGEDRGGLVEICL